MRRTILAFVVLAGAGGCKPGDFAAALDKAPVQVIDAPNGFGSNVGRTLLAVSPPADRAKVAGRLLFAGTDLPSLAVADFDGDGKPQVQTASNDELANLGLPALPAGQSGNGQGGISSLADSGTPGTILVGMPSVGRVGFLQLQADAGGTVTFSAAQPAVDGPAGETHFGLAVARGLLTQIAVDEPIVVADNGVYLQNVTTGRLEPANCTDSLALPTPPDLHRSLAVGNFVDDGSGKQEIAIGLPVKGGVGQVFILQYGPNPGDPSVAAELYCARGFGVPDPAGNPAVGGFGTALAVVPHATGADDLVVGAPPDRAYLFYGDGITPPKVFTNGNPSSEFGQRVALVDIDGDGVKELAITALQADVGDTKKAGQVLVYKLDGDGTTPIAIVYDSAPTANFEFFGIGLAELEFNSSRACPKGKDAHLLVAGSDSDIFTHFRFAGTADPSTALAPDPRCFAQ